jgi:hypothetical protein
MLLQHNISAAAYHGGKLNGVASNPDRCSDNTFIKTCSLYRDLFVTLDNLSSKFRMKHGEPTEEDYKEAEGLWLI